MKLELAKVGLYLLLVLAAVCQATDVGSPERPTQADNKENTHLKTIRAHQEALEFECAGYHDEQVHQIKKLLKFDQDNDKFSLPRPLSVQVPAVCLFLFSQPELIAPTKRIDMVNWLVDEREFRRPNRTHSDGQADGVSKRHIAASNLNDAGSLISNYLFNPSDLDLDNGIGDGSSNNNEDNEIPNGGEQETEKKKKKLDLDLEQLIGDERYQAMVNKSRSQLAAHLSPVILVPGLLGSRLEARINKMDRVNILCSKEHTWQNMWLSLRQLLPIMVDCWIDNVRLTVDPHTGWLKSPPGVQSRVVDFGSVESVRHLDVKRPQLTRYFAPLIERYEQIGYTADSNLLAAPYDFRLAPEQLADYFVDLRLLIEQARSRFGKQTTLVCHSMGCTNLLVFLRLQAPEWRQENVRKVIALSSPWGGAIKALKALIVGDQLDLPLISEAKMRDLARTFPSIAYLLPLREVFERPSRLRSELGGPVMVETPERRYKVGQLEQLLKELNLTQQLDWFHKSAQLIKPLEPLEDVQVDCFYSLNIPTPETVIFRQQADFPDGDYELTQSEGDGTVNLESLMVCEDWARLLPQKVTSKMVKNTNHIGTLSHNEVLAHITEDALTH